MENKKDFGLLLKEMRIVLHPELLKINGTKIEETAKLNLLDELEAKQAEILKNEGYTSDEFNSLLKDYFCDFTSEKPDEWVIRHDPENAQIIR